MLIFAGIVCKNKIIKWLLANITFPAIILASIYFYFSVNYYLSGYDFGLVLLPRSVAAIFLMVEYLLVVSISLMTALFDFEKITDKKEIKSLIKFSILSLLVTLPMQSFSVIFGETNIEMNLLNPAHLGWIISIFVVYLILKLLLKNEEFSTKKALLAVIIFYLFNHYNNVFKLGFDTNRLPLQLCNIVSYLFVIIILTKCKPLFNFLYIANPLGALIAIFTLSDRANIFSFWMIHYMIEHLYVFIIPLLFVDYGLFERPKLKILLKDYFIGFSIYYFACLLLNCAINGVLVPAFPNLSDVITNVNYFYLLECPVKDVFPFYPSLLVGEFSLFGQTLYVGYLVFIYFVFSALCFVLYFLGDLIGLIKRKVFKRHLKQA